VIPNLSGKIYTAVLCLCLGINVCIAIRYVCITIRYFEHNALCSDRGGQLYGDRCIPTSTKEIEL
jgi:hypothetical protein